ncbi:glycosyltransferase family 4 protein [Patescibacteria group bacterium]|nr:glycosyltransferase family 4 protein [Patescibacteria group bacterium]
MRIAVITNDGERGGGAGRIAALYTDALKRLGHEVRVWGPRDTFFQLSTMSGWKRLLFHLADLRANPDLVSQIRAWNPDALITHNLTGCGFGTPSRVQRMGVRWVHFLHDVQLFEPSGQMIAGESCPTWRWLWRMLWSRFRRCVLGEPDTVISPTQWLLDAHRRFGWFMRTPAVVIPNPIYLQTCTEEAVRDLKQIVFVGRIDWDKGIDVLIEAWARVRDRVSRLVLIGDGAWVGRIRAMKDSNIELCGVQPSDEVMRRLSGSGILVVPSRVHENQPTVILEGLVAGCKVIATDVGGVKETLSGAGEIVQPNSVDALVRAIETCVSTESSSAVPSIVAAHDPERCVSALIGALKSNL